MPRLISVQVLHESKLSYYYNNNMTGRGSGRSSCVNDLAVNRELLLDALARLPVEQRTVIRRSYYDAWTVAQIADDLHIDESTVTTRLHYGVRALLLSLQERGVPGRQPPRPAMTWGSGS